MEIFKLNEQDVNVQKYNEIEKYRKEVNDHIINIVKNIDPTFGGGYFNTDDSDVKMLQDLNKTKMEFNSLALNNGISVKEIADEIDAIPKLNDTLGVITETFNVQKSPSLILYVCLAVGFFIFTLLIFPMLSMFMNVDSTLYWLISGLGFMVVPLIPIIIVILVYIRNKKIILAKYNAERENRYAIFLASAKNKFNNVQDKNYEQFNTIYARTNSKFTSLVREYINLFNSYNNNLAEYSDITRALTDKNVLPESLNILYVKRAKTLAEALNIVVQDRHNKKVMEETVKQTEYARETKEEALKQTMLQQYAAEQQERAAVAAEKTAVAAEKTATETSKLRQNAENFYNRFKK